MLNVLASLLEFYRQKIKDSRVLTVIRAARAVCADALEGEVSSGSGARAPILGFALSFALSEQAARQFQHLHG